MQPILKSCCGLDVHKSMVMAYGNITDHHRFLLRKHFENIDHFTKQITEFDKEIQKKLVPFEKKFKNVQSVTGIKDTSAACNYC